jgi:hypothetical protein
MDNLTILVKTSGMATNCVRTGGAGSKSCYPILNTLKSGSCGCEIRAFGMGFAILTVVERRWGTN